MIGRVFLQPNPKAGMNFAVLIISVSGKYRRGSRKYLIGNIGENIGKISANIGKHKKCIIYSFFKIFKHMKQ